jgi:hypothetical protein
MKRRLGAVLIVLLNGCASSAPVVPVPLGEMWGFHNGTNGILYISTQSECESRRARNFDRASRATGPVDPTCSRLRVSEGQDYWVLALRGRPDGAVGLITRERCEEYRAFLERLRVPETPQLGTCQPVGVTWP